MQCARAGSCCGNESQVGHEQADLPRISASLEWLRVYFVDLFIRRFVDGPLHHTLQYVNEQFTLTRHLAAELSSNRLGFSRVAAKFSKRTVSSPVKYSEFSTSPLSGRSAI